MNKKALTLALGLAAIFSGAAQAATVEWTYHRTNDGAHPNGLEQEQLFLLNRARANPPAEGVWLETLKTNQYVQPNWNAFGVSSSALINAFNSIAAKPPAAFDVRLYRAANNWNNNLASRAAQDLNVDVNHDGKRDGWVQDHWHDVNNNGFADPSEASQSKFVTAEPISFSRLRGNVFSFMHNSLHAHAAYNIDWGGPFAGQQGHVDGMQNPPGHRWALMAQDDSYTNVGIAVRGEGNAATAVGPFLTTGNFALLNPDGITQFNSFIVGTVYEDINGDGRFNSGEGVPGVTVNPGGGTYYAVTSAGGGYAIPITATGSMSVTFSGGGITTQTTNVNLGSQSYLLDYVVSGQQAGSGIEDVFMQLNTIYHTNFGSGWGINRHTADFIAEFNQMPDDILFRVQGFDVDTNRDLRIFLNDKPISWLPRTATNQLGPYQGFSVPKGRQIPGINQIKITSARGGRWGVTRLRLSKITAPTIPVTAGTMDAGQYGWNWGTRKTHRTVIRTHLTGITGTKNVTLTARAFNNNGAAKVSVYANGIHIGKMAMGLDNRMKPTTMTIPASALNSGTNEIEFRHNVRFGIPWGIDRIRMFEQ